jgi:hypothetical protein
MHDPELPERPATLTVVRLAAHTGSAGPVQIHVDGQRCGQVNNADFAVIRCRPGTHDVVVQQSAYKSQTVTLSMSSGGRHELVCRINEPTGRFSRPTLVLMIGLTAVGALCGVPSIQRVLKPYEKYFGPVFLLTLGVAVLGMLSEMRVKMRTMFSRVPGAYLDLTETEPTVSEERIRSKLMDNIVKGSL